MKITIEFKADSAVLEAREPFPGSGGVLCQRACPHGCEDISETGSGLYAGASGTVTETERGMTGQAICVGCRKPVGTILVAYDTIFGIEEDRRVLHGRPRVY